MNGRVYDPGIGRFLSPDPLTEAAPHTQRFNRYAYVNNNPLSLVDPSGYSPSADSSVRLACSASDAKCADQLPEVIVSASRVKNDSGNPLNVARSASGLGQVADRSTSSDRGKQAQTANLAAPLQDPAPAAAPKRGKQRFEDWMVFLPLFMFDPIVDDLTASWPDWAYYGAQAGTVLIGPGKGTAAARGGTTVYRSVSAAGEVRYVGITNNLARRAAEHLRSSGIRIDSLMTGLSRTDARAVEQALIEIHGLGRNGGTLLNRINSIATSNPAYAQQLERGYELLRTVGY